MKAQLLVELFELQVIYAEGGGDAGAIKNRIEQIQRLLEAFDC